MNGERPQRRLRLPARLAHRIGARIANRITVAALALTMAFVLVTGAVSYTVGHRLVQRNIDNELNGASQLTVQRLELELNDFAADVDTLSRNTLVANGLADSEGREAYLVPFFQDFRFSAGVAANLCLTDFLGRPLACSNGRRLSAAKDARWLPEVIDHNRAYADVVSGPHGTFLRLAAPVLYRSTGRPEGMLLAELKLDSVFAQAIGPHGGHDFSQRLVNGAGAQVGCSDCAAVGDDFLKVRHPLSLKPPLDRLGLTVETAKLRRLAFAPLRGLALTYVLLGAVLLPLVWFAARRISLKISRSLVALDAAAKRVAEGGSLEQSVEVRGHDEVATLAASFGAMLQRLRLSHEQLEQRVEERTRELREHQVELRAQQRDYQVMFDSVHAMVWYVDTAGRVLRANHRAEEFTGMPLAEMVGRPLGALLPPSIAASYLADIDRAARDGEEFVGGIDSVSLGGGPLLWFESDKIPFRDEEGQVVGVTLFVTDVTERKNIETTLRKLSRAVEQSASAVCIMDREGAIEYVNPRFSEVTGYPASAVVGHNADMLYPQGPPATAYGEMRQAVLAGREWRGELQHRRASGERLWSMLSVSPVRGEDGEIQHIVAVSEDITEQKQLHQRMERLAFYDSLTGLANRRLFRDRLRQALKESRRAGNSLALMFLDLDKFKRINDTLGHEAGDTLLRSAGRRLEGAVREQDTVARLGGDEFTVLLPDIQDAHNAATVAHKILQTLERPLDVSGHEMVVTSSIGISLAPADGGDAETLMRNADMAMYRAKELGRNNFQFFTREMNTHAMSRLLMERELHQAVAEGQLVLHYQPKSRLSDDTVVGLEALLRWEHPGRGLMPPSEFLPMAEETGLIVPIGEWVLGEAMREAKRLERIGYGNMVMAVNLSAQQIQAPTLVESVRRTLSEAGLDPTHLELEITEGTLMENIDQAASTIRALKSLGVRVAVDDFGTGYSSLAYLERLPIDVLKVDPTFLERTRSESGGELASAIIALGHKLHLSVVAEGVERPEQLEFLKRNQCDVGQGFLIGRPLPASELEALLAGKGGSGKVTPLPKRH